MDTFCGGGKFLTFGGSGGGRCIILIISMQIHDTGEAETNGDMYGEGGGKVARKVNKYADLER